ncbi:precorrin-2 C(20)-methyltransferase [Reichenbachiella versicolor]|uniref:precorrin-2 C(20)-methyltransferase n=1 Tax=Reichenbachiella versicolor TaxID=1821036 RepID=UPI000D6E4D4E|nr:precorrin-2 C(20)-methyltransferase [Reichenbachiella versicolor]
MIDNQNTQNIKKQITLHPIHGVSLGPGDPDLITVKGLKTLQEADVIYYPGSLFRSGTKSSYSLSILEHYDLDPLKLKGFFLEMTLERKQAQKIYEGIYQDIKLDFERGLKVAIVSEGDLSTFSSFSYLLEKIKTDRLNIKLVPGISSFSLLAAQCQTPLCLQNDKVVILPRIQTEDELREAIMSFDTVILMKIKSVIDVIDNVISDANYQISYGEHLGTNNEFLASSWKDVKSREIPYFSIITIQK